MPVKKSVAINNVEILNSTAKVVITADNYKDLSGIVLFLKNKGVSAICFAQPQLSPLSSKNHRFLVPTKDMLPHLRKALQTARKKNLVYYLESLPLCLLPGEEDHFVLGSNPGVKMQFCSDCPLNLRCGGITKAQLIAAYGTQLLSWQFLFPKDFFTRQELAFLDKQLLRSVQRK